MPGARQARGRDRGPRDEGRHLVVKFLVLMAEEDTWNRWNALPEAEQQAAYDCFTAFTAAVEEQGKVIAGDALDRPEQARTVRPGAERLVTEGPFAETVEQMGGF